MPSPPDSPILFFDGVCGLCNHWVDFLLQHDPHGHTRFSPLQGETAHQLLPPELTSQLATVVLLDHTGLHTRTAAIWRLLVQLPHPWKFLGHLLRLIPPPLRDLGYRLVARYRYRIFGEKPTCRLPTPAERSRFLP